MFNEIIIVFFAFIFVYVIINNMSFEQENTQYQENTQENKQKHTQYQEKQEQLICVFDLDGTINISLENARKAIDTCKEYGAIIAFNTARPAYFYQDLNLKALGLTHDDFKEDFYYGNACNFINTELIAKKKVENMNLIKNKYNCNPKKMILFDDNILNIVRTDEAGYNVILANKTLNGGLHDNVDKHIEYIFNKT